MCHDSSKSVGVKNTKEHNGKPSNYKSSFIKGYEPTLHTAATTDEPGDSTTIVGKEAESFTVCTVQSVRVAGTYTATVI